jgi:regulator of replication initiation timing
MFDSPQQDIESRIEDLADHLSQIRRNMEKLIAENQRMREVVRIAESELRKRRDQVRTLESEIQAVQNGRLEARARVEHAIEKLDELISEQGEATS